MPPMPPGLKPFERLRNQKRRCIEAATGAWKREGTFTGPHLIPAVPIATALIAFFVAIVALRSDHIVEVVPGCEIVDARGCDGDVQACLTKNAWWSEPHFLQHGWHYTKVVVNVIELCLIENDALMFNEMSIVVGIGIGS